MIVTNIIKARIDFFLLKKEYFTKTGLWNTKLSSLVFISENLLETAINKAPDIMHKHIQIDIGTSMARAPAITLITKPDDIKITSKNIIPLKNQEYDNINIIYTKIAENKYKLIKTEIVNDIKMHTMEKYIASGIGKSPEAIGLFFLIGCFLSFSISKISLMQYIAMVIKINAVNANIDLINIPVNELYSWNDHDSFIENKTGIKMTRFLIHWEGLEVISIWENNKCQLRNNNQN